MNSPNVGSSSIEYETRRGDEIGLVHSVSSFKKCGLITC